MSSEKGQPLHMLFFPTMAPGHMQPMLDVAELFAGRGVRVSFLTTPANVTRVQPSVDRANMELHIIPFPSVEADLPEGCENYVNVPLQMLTNFFAALPMLQEPFDNLVRDLLPDCIVTDAFFYWSHPVTAELDIPRILFSGTSVFALCVAHILERYKPFESLPETAAESVVIPCLPHRIEMFRSQLPPSTAFRHKMSEQVSEANSKVYGEMVNTLYELEPDYVKHYMEAVGRKVWTLGPVATCNRDSANEKSHDCVKWLDSKSPASVVYVCFGSTGCFTVAQMGELALGLEASDHPFVWVVGKDGDEWLPVGFEERLDGKGLIVRGWAPQILILNHSSVGGFVTHCGGNSTPEGVAAGLPLLTWPMFAEHFYNERLIVDLLKIGVSIGVKIWSMRPEEREVMEAATVKNALNELMGGGEMAEERRRRTRELGEAARRAVEKGGSSYENMGNLIQELMERKNSN